ncbi:MAG TPA: efflux RND transporter periplasmic adaptor subunit [Thermoanaerobaculia bacterium]|nr:efflux RND transporter periplasmic adaptor subunit [Thermoanaerobaculia bacterium]
MSQIEQTQQQPADILATLGLDDSGRRRSWTRRVLWTLIVVAVIAAGLTLRSRQGGETTSSYVTSPANIGDLVETVSATGTLKALDTVEVGSESSGTIREVLVDFNDRVEKGQVLATIDPEQAEARADEASAQLRAAFASVNRAQATAEESAQSLARSRGLREAGLISEQDFDAAQATARRAQADVASARAQATVAEAALAESRSNLQKTAIRSPIEGIVLSRAVEPGQTVAASFQTPVLFTIARDLTDMALHVQVDEADVGKVREGQTATFTVDAYPQREFASQVVSLRNVATAAENVVTYEAVLAVDNAELLLRPGMTATASVVTDSKEDVLLVANAALRFTPPEVAAAEQGGRQGGLFLPGISQRGPRGGQRQQGQQSGDSSREKRASGTVWVLRQGQPVSVPVTPGATDSRSTEISSPQLKAGDEVIVDIAVQEEKS